MKQVKLATICEVFSGSSAPQARSYFDINGKPFVRVSDLGNTQNRILVETRDKVNETAIKEKRLVLAKKNTVVFPKSGAAILTNSRAILGVDAYIVGHLAALYPKDNIDSVFLYYLLCVIDMKNYVPNIGYPSLNLSAIKQIEVPVPFKNNQPDLVEQRRIADKIDKLFVETDKAIISTRGTEKQSGFILNSFVKKISTDKGWKQIQLGDFFNIYQPKTISTSQMVTDGKYKVYGANGVIGLYDKYNHEDSEVLLTCRGATCGSINISEPYSWINGNAMVIKPKTNKIDKSFISFILEIIDKSSAITGAAQPQITRKSLSPLTIPIPFKGNEPDIKKQKEVVLIFKQTESLVNNLRQETEKQLLQFNFLRQSTLNQAFIGNL